MAPNKNTKHVKTTEGSTSQKTDIESAVLTLEERLNGLEGSMGKIVDLLEDLKKEPGAPVSASVSREEAAIVAARPNKFTVNPEWESAAKEILGEYLDHTEVEHEKTGGIKFTVVIKSEKSNAPQDYLQRTKSDRRTKEVGAAGMDGVTEWCKLIRSNLKRTEKN